MYASAYVAEHEPHTGSQPPHMDGKSLTSRQTSSRVIPKSRACPPSR